MTSTVTHLGLLTVLIVVLLLALEGNAQATVLVLPSEGISGGNLTAPLIQCGDGELASVYPLTSDAKACSLKADQLFNGHYCGGTPDCTRYCAYPPGEFVKTLPSGYSYFCAPVSFCITPAELDGYINMIIQKCHKDVGGKDRVKGSVSFILNSSKMTVKIDPA